MYSHTGRHGWDVPECFGKLAIQYHFLPSYHYPKLITDLPILLISSII